MTDNLTCGCLQPCPFYSNEICNDHTKCSPCFPFGDINNLDGILHELLVSEPEKVHSLCINRSEHNDDKQCEWEKVCNLEFINYDALANKLTVRDKIGNMFEYKYSFCLAFNESHLDQS